MKMKRNPVSLL